jgi:hypothetical protein
MSPEIFPQLRESLAAVALHFRAHPLRFLSEGDLKALVHYELALRIDGPYGFTTADTQRHGQVHCDWPSAAARRFDVAIADASEADWAVHSSPPVRVGILTRLWLPNAASGIGPDLERLRNGSAARRPSDFTGILMVFCHPEVSWKTALGLYHPGAEVTVPRNGFELQIVDADGCHAALI